MNELAGLANALESGSHAVEVAPALISRARRPIDRMLAFTAALQRGASVAALVPHLGAV